MSNPEAIQQEIERTRAGLSDDVDRLTEKVSPPRIVGRQLDRVKSGAATLRDRVMGSSERTSRLPGGDSGGSAVESAKEVLGSAPETVRAQTQGNPLAVGLVAFGLGMVISSLLPASQPEQQVAAQAEEKAKELAEPAKRAGQQLLEDMKPAVQGAADQVKSTAQDAAQHTSEQARSRAQDVRAPLQQ